MDQKYDIRIYEKKKKYKRLDNEKFEAQPSDYEYLEKLELELKENEEAAKLKIELGNSNDPLFEDTNSKFNKNEYESDIEETKDPTKLSGVSEEAETKKEMDPNKLTPIIIGKYNLIYILYSKEFLILILYVLFHILVFLLSQWNINASLFIAYKNLETKDKKKYLYHVQYLCTHVYIKPKMKLEELSGGSSSHSQNSNTKNRSKNDLSLYKPKGVVVELKKVNNDIFFFYKQKKYLFNYETSHFQSLHHFDGLPLSVYTRWRGLIELGNEDMYHGVSYEEPLHDIYNELTINGYSDNFLEHLKEPEVNLLLDKISILYDENRRREIFKKRKKTLKEEGTINTLEAENKVIRDRTTNGGTGNSKTKIHVSNVKRFEKINIVDGSKIQVENPMNSIIYSKNYFEIPRDLFVNYNVNKYGENVYDIPAPCFKTLLYEAMLSPFFIFQFFSIILWMLDSYWHFGFFSIFVLIILESQMINKRIREFNMINGMKVPFQNVYVFRNEKWKMLKSNYLQPGDVYIIENKFHQSENICTCETLLIDGVCITDESILTGESVPLIKAPLDMNESKNEFTKLDIKQKHKKNVVFAGTNILMTKNENTQFRNKKMPTNGCIGIVLKNGFTTYQGKLVRTIINTSEKINSCSFDSIVFLFILLIFSLCSSAYVVYQVLYFQHERNLYKLILSISHIITAVIPPEFPITLSLAVTISIVYLYNMKIYCTEPFRLPFSGKAQICAFDKTGTLTEDNMILLGLFGLEHSVQGKNMVEVKEPIIDSQKIPFLSLAVIAGCHSLCTVNNRLLGDPLEKIAFLKLNCSMKNLDHILVKSMVLRKGATQLSPELEHFRIYKRYFFTSELQRMTCVLEHEGYGGDWMGSEYFCNPANIQMMENNKHSDLMNSNRSVVKMNSTIEHQYLVVSKGSPEIMKKFLKNIPCNYDEMLNELVIKGYRVLCLAARVLDLDPSKANKSMNREDIEKDLIFCGFLTFICPIKKWTAGYIRDIHEAGLKNIMITGDNALTACQVAEDIHMISPIHEREVLILKENKESISMEVMNPKNSISILTKLNMPKKKKEKYLQRLIEILENQKESEAEPSIFFVNRENKPILPFYKDCEYICLCGKLFSLCITGDVIEYFLQDSEPMKGKGRRSKTENHKMYFEELIKRGRVFCRVSPKNKEAIIKTLNRLGNVTIMCGDGTNDMAALKAAHVGISLLSVKICYTENNNEKEKEQHRNRKDPMLMNNRRGMQMDSYQMRLQQERKEKLEEMMQSMDDSIPLIKLGEASIASPFTYKGTDIQCVKEIISCGRCALSKVIMMYKLMIINSLITAFSVSMLTLDGVKLSDVQTTVISLLYTALIVLISKATPLKIMSDYCPPNSLFNISVISTLIIQVVIHFTVLVYGWNLAASARSPDYVPDVKGDFSPNLVNTCIYYLIYCINLSIFSSNYEGLPFMFPLHKNKEMIYIFTVSFMLLFVQVLELFPFLNTFFSLVSFPNYRMKFLFLSLMIVDVALPYILSLFIRKFRLYLYRTFRIYV